jgi:alpha-tubulin suppressor-like RCC1 family protein
LATDGTLLTWGCGSDGRLGHPEYEGFVYLYKESHPKQVDYFKTHGKKVVDVSASYYHMLAIAI